MLEQSLTLQQQKKKKKKIDFITNIYYNLITIYTYVTNYLYFLIIKLYKVILYLYYTRTQASTHVSIHINNIITKGNAHSQY